MKWLLIYFRFSRLAAMARIFAICTQLTMDQYQTEFPYIHEKKTFSLQVCMNVCMDLIPWIRIKHLVLWAIYVSIIGIRAQTTEAIRVFRISLGANPCSLAFPRLRCDSIHIHISLKSSCRIFCFFLKNTLKICRTGCRIWRLLWQPCVPASWLESKGRPLGMVRWDAARLHCLECRSSFGYKISAVNYYLDFCILLYCTA